MSTLIYQVIIHGADFDPNLIPAELSGAVTNTARRGEASKRGTLNEEGFASLDVGSIDEAVAALRSVRSLQPDQAQHAELVVGYWFDEQCNLEFSEAELSALATERMSLSISCYPRS